MVRRRGERVGRVSGVLGAALLVVAACNLSSTPSVDATPAVVRHHLGNHYALAMTSAYATVIGALLLVPFLASLRTFTSRHSAVGSGGGP